MTSGGRALVLGIAGENRAVVTATAPAWLALIAALLRVGRPLVPVVLLAATGATVLDVGDVARKIGETRTGLALLAGGVAVGYEAAAVLAARALIRVLRSPSGSDRAPLQGTG